MKCLFLSPDDHDYLVSSSSSSPTIIIIISCFLSCLSLFSLVLPLLVLHSLTWKNILPEDSFFYLETSKIEVQRNPFFSRCITRVQTLLPRSVSQSFVSDPPVSKFGRNTLSSLFPENRSRESLSGYFICLLFLRDFREEFRAWHLQYADGKKRLYLMIKKPDDNSDRIKEEGVGKGFFVEIVIIVISSSLSTDLLFFFEPQLCLPLNASLWSLRLNEGFFLVTKTIEEEKGCGRSWFKYTRV